MSSVDNRAVHMTFDNASFEKNLADTVKSMDTLKKTLDFTNAKKSFADLGDHASKFNLNGVGATVDGISSKFLALGTIAITTLANIVDRAVDAGIRIAKSLTIDPITQGFSDYNAKLSSVQTITNATGESLQTVSGYFDQLDTYADKTVFNLSDMTSAFAKFTNAGIDMDVAVPAIKGIANMTALAGQGADAAAIGMYNLSQSLSGGFLTTTDYKSLNLANIATKQWKDYLIQAAVAAGTLKQTGDDTFQVISDGSNFAANSAQLFNNELSRGWANTDILLKVLGDFGDETTDIGKKAQSAAQDVKSLPMMMDTLKAAVGTGWTDTFQIILGNLDESKALFTDLTNSVSAFLAKGTDARNNLLQGWKDLGGRTKLIEGIKDAFASLAKLLDVVKVQFGRFFGSLDSQTLYNITEAFASFMDRIRNSEDLWDRISTAFGAIFAGLKIGVEVVKGVIGVFADLFQHFAGGGASGQVLDFIDRFALMIIGLHTALVTNGGLDRIFATITEKLIAFGEALKNPGKLLQDVIEAVKNTFRELFSIIFEGDFTGVGFWEEDSPIVAGLFKFRDFILGIIDSIKSVFDGFNIDIPPGISNFFENLFGNVDDNTSNSFDLSGGIDRISGALGVLKDAAELAKGAVGWIFDRIQDLGGFVVNAGAGIIDFFENLGPNINDFVMSPEFDKLLQFMQSLGILMGGAGVGKIAKDGLKVDLTGGSLTNLGNMFKMISDMGPSVKKNIEGLTGVFKSMSLEIKAKALLKIAEAIGLITASVVVLSFIDPDALAKSLTALAVGFGQLIAAMALLNTGAGPKSAVGTATTAASMIAIATAVLILSGAVAVLAQLNWDEIGKGLTGVTGLMIIMAGAAKIMQGSSASLIAAGVGMTAVAIALTILAGAMKVFATMTWEEIGKGLTAVAGGLVIIAGAMQLMPASTILIGPGLVAVGIALTELGAALIIFATMSWSEIGKGMAVLAGGLLIIAGAMQLMPASSIITGPGLIAIATGLTILSGALKVFATMSWEEIGKSMTVLASSLLILAGAMALMEGGIAGAIAVGVMAASLLLLNKSLKEFAKMSWKELGKGLAVMAAALTALGLAAYALSATGATGAIFLLGVALLALGAGFALIGVGATLVAEAFQVLAAAGTAGIDVLMYAIDQLLIRLPDMAKVFAQSIINIADTILTAAPTLIEKLGAVIGSLLKVIADNADNFGIAATAWILAILKTVRDTTPDLVKTGLQVLLNFLHGIEDNIKEITKTVTKIIAAFLEELAANLPDIVDGALDVVVAFVQGLTQDDHIADIVEAGVLFFVKILEGIVRDIDDIVDTAVDVIEAFVKAIGDNVDDVIGAGIGLLAKLIEGIGNGAILLVAKGAELLIMFMDAISDNTLYIVNAALDIVIDFINGLADAIDAHRTDLYKAGLNLGLAIADGFTFGLASKGITVTKKVGGFFSKVVDTAKGTFDSSSPSMVFYALGEDVANGFILGLQANNNAVEKSSTSMFTAFSERFISAIADTHAMMQNSSEFNPTITPVLDLTQVQNAAGQINGLMGTPSLVPSVSTQQASQLLAETSRSEEDTTPETTEPRQLIFNQTNNSPEALNQAIIYKRTRSQIVLAKKELENA